MGERGAPPGRVTGLWCYPIKSCRGVGPLAAAAVARTGLQGDRRWALVDGARGGRFLSQRRCPGMARIRPSLPPEFFSEPGWVGGGGAFTRAPPGAVLRVEAPEVPGVGALEVPLAPAGASPERWAAAGSRDVSVWGWKGRAVDEGDAAAAWFAQVLGVGGVRLVRYCGDDPEVAVAAGGEGETRRAVERDAGCRPLPPEDVGGAPAQTAFADGFPILLTSEATLAELNGCLEAGGSQPVGMDRFRPNITVAGFACGAEDAWEAVELGGDERGGALAFTVAKPCARCAVPGIDQRSGEVPDPGEPLRTLGELRSGQALLAAGREAYSEPSWRGQAFFGWNLAPRPGAAGRVLRLGAAARPQ